MTDLSFIDNYAKIRRRLYTEGCPDPDKIGNKVVSRRHAQDLAIKRVKLAAEQRQILGQQLAKALDALPEIQRRAATVPSWKAILRETAAKYGLTPLDLVCHSRKAFRVVPRQEAAWRMRAELGMSLPDIGHRLGGRDHTTILHSIRTHARRNGLPLTPGGADA